MRAGSPTRSPQLETSLSAGARNPSHTNESVSYDQPSLTQDAIGEAMDAGFGHIVVGLPAPYPAGVAQWVTDELINTSAH